MINTLKIDEIYEAEVIALENEGKGVCKVGGIIVFVPKTLKGEKIRFRVTEIKKNFAKGKLVQVLKESDKRVKPSCPYYEECGGCNLRHQEMKENLKFKKEKIENALKRIGKIDKKVEDVIPSFKNDNYRNKISLKVEDDKIGFYGEGTYQLIDIDNCLLAVGEINEAIKVIRTYIKGFKNKIKTVTIKYGNAMDDILIDIYSLSQDDVGIINYLTSNISNLKTVIFNDKVIFGTGYIKEISNGLMFNCSSKSFFQVNGMQAEKMYDEAIKLAKLKKDDMVLDLYCGTGTIGMILSSHVKKVIGVEILVDAIINARENLRINDINNESFICGDASKVVSKIKEKIDVLFVDPPRAGVDRKAIAIIKKMMSRKIVYISCNPVTMARDLSYLNDMYDIKKIVPFDMFPNTSHVECVCILERKSS